MKTINLIKSLGLLCLASPFVLVKASNECESFLKIFEDKSSLCTCEVNDQGKINYLNVNDMDLTESDINKMMSYDTITELVYVLNMDSDHKHPGYGKFPLFSKLKNLKSLIIEYNDYYDEKNGLITIPKNNLEGLSKLETLIFDGIKINQDCIDIISTFTNLKSLVLAKNTNGYHDSKGIFPINLVKALDGQVKNLTIGLESKTVNLKKMSGLKECHIHYERMPTTNLADVNLTLPESNNFNSLKLDVNTYEDGPITLNVDLTKFKNLKSLDLNEIKITKDVISKISKLTNLNELEFGYYTFDASLLDQLKTLKNLTSM
ncbi:hypothetical protein PIROE2DRAFT_61159 [Piromyces sp. E2]|nr:hypothetical protein PIROE2DRAFT_61159 [Piromyces sp. E2]|eukprot:OUM63624.1 hypothetical protein PIROE2DRAFT_61159 [Piromyces sp. E2]